MRNNMKHPSHCSRRYKLINHAHAGGHSDAETAQESSDHAARATLTTTRHDFIAHRKCARERVATGKEGGWLNGCVLRKVYIARSRDHLLQ